MCSPMQRLLQLLFLLTLTGSALAETPMPQALRGYIRIALESNPEILAARAKWKQNDAKVDAAASNLYPRIDFTSRATGFVGGRILDIPGIGKVNTAGLGIVPWDNKFEATWAIGNIAVWQGRAAASAFLDASTAEVQAKERDLILKTSEAYYNFAKASAFVEVKKNSLLIAEENLRLIRSLKSADRVPPNDVLRAEVGVANAESEVILAKRGAVLAQTAFNSLLGRNSDEPIVLPSSEELTAIENLSGVTTDRIREQVVLPPITNDAKQAFDSRPELRSLDMTVNALEGTKRVYSSDYLPNVALFGSYGWQEQSLKFSSDADMLVGGVQFRWNLFNGFGTNAKVEEADAMINELKYQRQNALNGIRLELESARTEKVSALERLAIFSKAKISAEENFRITKALYDQGSTQLVNLLDAQTTLDNAKISYTTALYDLFLAEVRYRRALGNPLQ